MTTTYPDIFSAETTKQLFERLDKLTPETKALWGKMNVPQMLAHCCVSYEHALGYRNDGPPVLMKMMLKWFFKKAMTNEIPYKQNLPTAPSFVVADERVLTLERDRLKELIKQFQEKGREYFDGREQISLGKLSATEWNNLLYKHIDHHLRQFGV